MTGDAEGRYRRLLRWYPPRWRKANGEVMLGMLLDAAEDEGRDRPSSREVRSIAMNGAASRLDARSALIAAIAATASAIVGGVIMAFSTQIPVGTLTWIAPALLLFITPTLLVISATGWLRALGNFGALRALVVPALGLLANAAGLAAALAWSAGFAAADAGGQGSPFVVLWFAAAWLLGTLVLTAFVEAILRRTRLPAVARWVVAVLAGALAAPTLGWSFLTPTVGVVVGIALMAALLVQRSRQGEPGTSPPIQLAPAHPTVQSQSRERPAPLALVTALAWGSVALGLGSVAFALTGSEWFDHSLDATQTMQLGIAAGLVAAIPLVGAFALSLNARGRAGVALPAGLMVTSLLVGAIASFSGFAASGFAASGFAVTGFDAQWVGLLAAAALASVAVGATAHAVIRASRPVRMWLSVAIGAGYAVTFGILLMFAIAFVAPVLGMFFATVWMRRARSSPLSQSVAAAVRA